MSNLMLGARRRTLNKARPYDVFVVGCLGDSRVSVSHELRLSEAVMKAEAWLRGQDASSVAEIWLEGVVCVWASRADDLGLQGASRVAEVGVKPHWPLVPGRHRWRSKSDDWVPAPSSKAASAQPERIAL